MALWRIDACKAETGDRSNTSIYNAIRAGLFTRPVAIGQRAKAWPDYEVKAIPVPASQASPTMKFASW